MTGNEKMRAMAYAMAYLDGACAERQDGKTVCIQLGDITDGEWKNFELNETNKDRYFLGYKEYTSEGTFEKYHMLLMIDRTELSWDHLVHLLTQTMDCKLKELKPEE